MLFFIDESWQASQDGQRQAGVLASICIKSNEFNKCSKDIYSIKVRNVGFEAAQLELKGRGILKPYVFKLQEKGIPSIELKLAEEILDYINSVKLTAMASIVVDKKELDLNCADEDHLERPFFFLFERINQFMQENYPDLTAKLIFDDRGLETNQRISKTISNFFHKSKTGQSFDKIVKVPFFVISNENIGIQLADILAYILGRSVAGDPKLKKYHALIKHVEFRSREELASTDGKKYRLLGYKIIKNKEAGDLQPPKRTANL
jgi:hypothetical protein